MTWETELGFKFKGMGHIESEAAIIMHFSLVTLMGSVVGHAFGD